MFEFKQDANFDGTPDILQGLQTTHTEINANEGGSVYFNMKLDPNVGGYIYWIFGSATGTAATKVGLTYISITPDWYTQFLFSEINKGGSIFKNALGVFGNDGQPNEKSKPVLMVPKDPGLSGITLYHVATLCIVSQSGLTPIWASNWVRLNII